MKPKKFRSSFLFCRSRIGMPYRSIPRRISAMHLAQVAFGLLQLSLVSSSFLLLHGKALPVFYFKRQELLRDRTELIQAWAALLEYLDGGSSDLLLQSMLVILTFLDSRP